MEDSAEELDGEEKLVWSLFKYFSSKKLTQSVRLDKRDDNSSNFNETDDCIDDIKSTVLVGIEFAIGKISPGPHSSSSSLTLCAVHGHCGSLDS